MEDNLCMVCRDAIQKYKCPACASQSCSLACFKQHKAECTTAMNEVSTTQGNSSDKQEVMLDNIKANGIDYSKLELLFTRYPKLRLDLKDIYLSSLKPDERSHDQKQSDANANLHVRPSRPYDTGRDRESRKSLDVAMAKLRSLMETDGEVSEALREFVDVATARANASQPARLT